MSKKISKEFKQVVLRAVEIRNAQSTDKKDLLSAVMQANDEHGTHWNPMAIHTTAYRIIHG